MATVNPESALQASKDNITLPEKDSHKGQNGRLLIIGGSKIFHAASLWSAEVSSRFVDLVHYCSTKENEEVFVQLKSKFTNGIIIPKAELEAYIEEDDCILVGPGMERGDVSNEYKSRNMTFEEVISLEDEATYTYSLLKHLLTNYPRKRFILDAAALQMLDPELLKTLEEPAVLTPHSREFEKLFRISLDNKNKSEISELVKAKAEEYSCVIMLKKVVDYISNGSELITITGGNEGLSKGGSGDALAGLTAAFHTTSDAMSSCVIASYIVKTTGEKLYEQKGSFYNTSDLIASIPSVAKGLLY